MEDNLRWKTTFGGRQPLVKDNLWWKTTFGGGHHSVEDNLWWKTPFSGRRPPMEDNLWWRVTFGERRLLVEDNPCMLLSPLCSIFLLKMFSLWWGAAPISGLSFFKIKSRDFSNEFVQRIRLTLRDCPGSSHLIG